MTEQVRVAVTDIDGLLRGKTILNEKWQSAIEHGFGFCDVVFGWDSHDNCYDNVSYTGWHTGYPDAKAIIDPATERTIPWERSTPFFLADFDCDVCPRNLLKSVVKKAQSLQLDPVVAMEFEWFNFKETPQSLREKDYKNLTPLSPGMFGYSLIRPALHPDYFADLMEQLRAFGVPLEGLHTESGPGVLEAAILYSSALEAADRAVLFKTAVKQIAYQHGVLATFMARWNPDLPGCGGHIHQSLWREGENAFNDEALMHHFLAGQLTLLPEILPMFAPTVNSYKRLVEGFWAPTRASWGVENRTTAFRVIPTGGKSTRIETRVSGSDVNPYLAIAASLASGLYGIEHKLELPCGQVQGSSYASEKGEPLPKSLIEAVERFEASASAKEIFGQGFCEHFAATRRWEWEQAQKRVTHWELERYFETV